MNQHINLIALIVKDYDEAIKFYTQKLNFTLVEDTQMSTTKRWVIVSPNGNNGTRLLLAKAADHKQMESIGNQTGGRVFLFLHTDDFWRDYDLLITNNVKIMREPSDEPYGTVAVFADLYGNLWDLVQPRANTIF